MQIKELLSQNEIDALLDVFNAPGEEKNTDVLLEIRMARVAKGIANYFDTLALAFDKIRVVKSTSLHENSFNYTPKYAYLQNISIDNSLALAILASRFGAKERSFSLDRPLTSLEKRLIEDVCKEIEYIAEKELDDYSSKDNMADHGLLIRQEERESMIQFSFVRR